ncbi:glycosyltransferase family 2 protein [Actinotalea sp. Marseille-Q4924]|uniref:glycosyltransferase family 2 protein n=1 Tax=Actinotalea sp. Marseille-Q4924 TaxID=2866571 RepID=UPI001CE3E555|nr:glycosyltransferase family 2 protein [Actinotalea sp. Marseille-Q4924]
MPDPETSPVRTPAVEGPVPAIDVVVVNWNGGDLLAQCLESLRADMDGLPTARCHVWLVDNASTDGSADRAQERFGDMTVIRLDRNTGFAGGAAAGIRASSGDVVVLVNNDAVVTPGFLRSVVGPIEADPRVGATTGRVLLAGEFVPSRPGAVPELVGHDGRGWRRSLPGETGTTLLNSTGNEVTRSGNGRDRDWLASASTTALPEVFGFNGGCAALRRRALDHVGSFDESLFLYYEDTELSWRLRRGGWRVVHVPDAVTVHVHAASSGTTSELFEVSNARNRLLVALLHAPWAVVVRACARTLVRTVRGPRRRRWVSALTQVVVRTPRTLARRRALDRTAVVPRRSVAALLVDDGPGRSGRAGGGPRA